MGVAKMLNDDLVVISQSQLQHAEQELRQTITEVNMYKKR